MIDRIKVVLTTFCYVTTCVVCGTAIFTNIFYEDPQTGPEILWQIMFVLTEVIYIVCFRKNWKCRRDSF